jgi:MraZ protein
MWSKMAHSGEKWGASPSCAYPSGDGYRTAMFFGEFEHTLDDKGRVFLPARHRDELGDVVMLSRGYDGQIDVYPVEAWKKIAETVGQQNQARSAVRDVSRFVFAASECQVDRQGRIVVPPTLRKHAGLNGEVVIIGLNDHLEMWGRDRWDKLTTRLVAEGSNISEQMAELGVKL